MSMSVTPKGSYEYIDGRVKIHNVAEIPPYYANKLIDAAGVMDCYLKENDLHLKVVPVRNVESGGLFTVFSIKDGSLGDAFVPFKDTGKKSFLKNVYEQIQFLVEGTKPKIESIKWDTLKRLHKIGKVRNIAI